VTCSTYLIRDQKDDCHEQKLDYEVPYDVVLNDMQILTLIS
jgi:hypothetical protein